MFRDEWNEIKWICRNFRYIHEGRKAPERCPVGEHPKSYYKAWCENY